MKYGSQGPAQTQCDRVWVVQPGHLLSLNTLGDSDVPRTRFSRGR